MMISRASYNFVKFKPINTYSNILDVNKRPRYISFQERKDAKKYIDYMTNFRIKHGYWQRIDLSELREKNVRKHFSFKSRDQEIVEHCLEIETVDYDELQMMFSMHTFSLLHCYKFDVESDRDAKKYSLSLSAEEFDRDPDSDKYIKMLDYNFKI